MPDNDNSENPIKGFDLVTWPEGLYLQCRGRDCHWQKRIHRVVHLEKVLVAASEHRVQCKKPVQVIKTKLPFEVKWPS